MKVTTQVVAVAIVLCHQSSYVANAEPRMTESTVIREFTGCDIKGLTLHLDTITVNVTGRGVTTLNGRIVADEDIGQLTLMQLRVEKCRSFSDKSSCEFYTNLRLNDPCQSMILAKNFVWSPLFNTNPALSCPIKKGVYKLNEGTIKANHMGSTYGVYWKVTVKLFRDKNLVSCVRGGAEIVAIRNKSKSKNH